MVRVAVRVRPGASRTRVGGAYGSVPQQQLVVAVTERAVDGAATAAVLRAVAEAFDVRGRQVSLVAGERSRSKVLDIDIDPAQGARLLTALLRAGS